MSDHEAFLSQSATLVLVTLMACVLHPSIAMCESRCERSIPHLNSLRSLWSRSFKRMGEVRVSFENFLLFLIQNQSPRNPSMRQLRDVLLRTVGQYQDCVMACEHQFSKRNGHHFTQGNTAFIYKHCQRLLFHQSMESKQALAEDVSRDIASLCSFLQKMEKLIT